MKWSKHWIIPLVALLVVVLSGKSIYDKEQLMAKGKQVYFHLAPVDPRSLMQGDYMRLSFAVLDSVTNKEALPKRGYCLFYTDSSGVLTGARFQKEDKPVRSGEQLLKYTTNFNGIQIGAESYFFQEGKADRYNNAAYGLLRIDAQGNSLLIGLCDSTRKKL
ncbi:MAG: GDYXXLXY domain-containing protein [Bacteroidota bacterium]|jgi:uncharacterized membrane-anchored protein